MLGPIILAGTGLSMVIASAINAGTFGVAPQDAGVASATLRRGPLGQERTPPTAHGEVTKAQAEAGQERVQ